MDYHSTLPPPPNDVSGFLTKKLAKDQQTYTIAIFFLLNGQYFPVYNKTDRKANTCYRTRVQERLS